MQLRIVRLVLLLFIVAAIPAAAQSDLYDNGPTNGTTDAWSINFGFIVSNSFTMPWTNQVDGLSFAAWLFPGDILQSAEVSITSSEFGGTTYFDGIVNFTQSNCEGNQYGFNVCTESGYFSGVFLNSGTYWLNLQNAIVNTGDPVYWDENSGPSQASENSIGTIPSESFTVLGGCTCCQAGANCGPPPQSPEPTSCLLFGSGAVVMFGCLGPWFRRFF
jgi:hypothetical protein